MQQRSHASARDLFEKAVGFTKADEFRRAGLYPYFPEFSNGSDSADAEVMMSGRRILMFGSNNYLGLTTHLEVKAAAKAAIDQYGTGCSGSRMLNGTMDIHVRLEETLSRFMNREAALVFGTGFQTNLGALSTIAQKGDVLVADRNIHASILDGCLASFARTTRFRHNDMDDLEKVLSGLSPDEGRLIVVDGVFSMEGDAANLPEIVKLARRHGARVYVDEAHAIGVLGANGRGTAEHFGVECEEKTIPDAMRWGLEDTILYSSDYPHWDGDWPHTVKGIRARKDISDGIKQKMMHDNVARFYKLDSAA